MTEQKVIDIELHSNYKNEFKVIIGPYQQNCSFSTTQPYTILVKKNWDIPSDNFYDAYLSPNSSSYQRTNYTYITNYNSNYSMEGVVMDQGTGYTVYDNLTLQFDE